MCKRTVIREVIWLSDAVVGSSSGLDAHQISLTTRTELGKTRLLDYDELDMLSTCENSMTPL